MARILIVLTSRRDTGGNRTPAGFHWEEFVTPYWALRDAGHEVIIGSVLGGEATGLPGSEVDGPHGRISRAVHRFQERETEMELLQGTLPIVAAKAEDFDALVFPGGVGPLWDLHETPEVGALVSAVLARGGIVATISTGAAALLTALDAEGEPVVRRRRVTTAPDTELSTPAPYSIEAALAERGARIGRNEYLFRPHALRDGGLVTGQNPASAAPVARLVLSALADMRQGGAQPTLELVPPALFRRPG